jgi:hypothetical protein
VTKRPTAEALLELGLMLHRAKHNQGKEEFPGYLSRMGITRSRALRAVKLTRDWRLLRNAARLPPEIGTLEQISKLDDIVFGEALALKIINPRMTFATARRLRGV